MPHEDILDRLRIDSGQRTIGQLVQDREAAAHEIRQLRAENERLRVVRMERKERASTAIETSAHARRPGALVRIRDVCEMIGVGRSTIYQWVAQGTFPSPVRISERAVRWRIEEIERWRDTLDSGMS